MSFFPNIQFFDIGIVNSLTRFVGGASGVISKVKPFLRKTSKLSISNLSFEPVNSKF